MRLSQFIIERAKVRISAFLNISYIGLTGYDFELVRGLSPVREVD